MTRSTVPLMFLIYIVFSVGDVPLGAPAPSESITSIGIKILLPISEQENIQCEEI